MKKWMIKKLSNIVRKAYLDKGRRKGFKLPFYFKFGEYMLCVYAMNLDWPSLRIKIEKDFEIVLVIKKGKY